MDGDNRFLTKDGKRITYLLTRSQKKDGLWFAVCPERATGAFGWTPTEAIELVDGTPEVDKDDPRVKKVAQDILDELLAEENHETPDD